MHYNVYSTDGESTAIITAVAEAGETACWKCGATWLTEATLGIALITCPYCGTGPESGIATRTELAEQSGAASSYGRDLRGTARQFWGGSIDYDQAFFFFMETIRPGLMRAWHDGARECGIQPSELTPEELSALDEATFNETSRLGGLMQFIEQNSKAAGVKLAVVLARIDLWTLRYTDVVNRARMMACADKKLIWRIGPTMEHCVDCANLSDKVKRGSQWTRANIRPQSRDLACRGYRCLCVLEPTDLPMSKGPLPRLRGAG